MLNTDIPFAGHNSKSYQISGIHGGMYEADSHLEYGAQ
jgi:hypothetical protein